MSDYQDHCNANYGPEDIPSNDEPMTPIQIVRCALAMRDAGYDAAPKSEDVAILLQFYDDAHSDLIRRHKDACDYWMALTLIRKYADEDLGPSRSSLLNKIAKLCDEAIGPPLSEAVVATSGERQDG